MRIITTIDLPVFQRQVIIAVGASTGFINSYLTQYLAEEHRYLLDSLKDCIEIKASENSLSGSYITNPQIPAFGLIYVPNGKMKKAELLSTLVHEITHSVFHHARDIGLKVSTDSEEFYTYTTAYIFKAAYEVLYPEKAKRK